MPSPDAPPRAVAIFDLDGTLVDSAPGIVEAFRRTLADTGRRAPDEVLATLIGPPLTDSFRTLGFAESELRTVVARYREHYAAIGVPDARPYDGVDEMLTRLREQGWILAVATAKRQDFAERILTNWRLDRHFAAVAGASLDGRLGPKTEIVSRARALLAPNAPRWMVGDRRFDVLAARACGLECVGVTWGYGTLAELDAAGARAVVDTPTALGDLLAGTPVVQEV
ncbi:MAG: HAD hydrolase-like protein [Acidimicrobiales bacterium]